MKTLFLILLLSPSVYAVNDRVEAYGNRILSTTAIQTALDAVGQSGGGEVSLTSAGTYWLTIQGANPYVIGHLYCLELKYDNVTFRLGKGVILKLADKQQTDAPVDILIFRSRKNLTIEGGTITGNTAGQSWTGGYAQINNGVIISSYGTASTFSSDITIRDMNLSDHFSNPINIDIGGGSSARNERIRISNIHASDCGEGIQVIRADDVWIENCLVDSPNHVAVGDAIEVSHVTRYHLTNNTARNHQSSGFDIFGSNHGIVDGFIVEDCPNGINVHGGGVVPTPEDILVTNGLIYNAPSNVNNDGVELLGTSLKNITFKNIKIQGNAATIGFQGPFDGEATHAQGPVSIIDCEVSGAQEGMVLKPISSLTIRGGDYSNNIGRGIVLLYGPNLTVDDVKELRVDGVTIRNNGSWGLQIDNQGNKVPTLTGSIQNCILTGNGGAISTSDESENLVVRNNIQ